MTLNPEKLAQTPTESEVHHWADYVELVCLTDSDGEFSLDRLRTAIKEGLDLGATRADALDQDDLDVTAQILESESELTGMMPDFVEYDVADTAEIVLLESEEIDPSGFDADRKDRRTGRAEEIFRHLISRDRLYGDDYPFVLESRGSVIMRRQSIVDRHFAYLFFLICASQRYVDSAAAPRVTQEFEIASGSLFAMFLPSAAKIDHFGTAKGAPPSVFSGGLFEKVKEYAKLTRNQLAVTENSFSPFDSGDNGFDWIAWVPMHDNARGVPTYSAQCTCGAGDAWKRKQLEASELSWDSVVHFYAPLLNFTFIPFHFRDSSNDWASEGDVKRGVLVDRYRALRLGWASNLPLSDVAVAAVVAAQAVRRASI